MYKLPHHLVNDLRPLNFKDPRKLQNLKIEWRH